MSGRAGDAASFPPPENINGEGNDRHDSATTSPETCDCQPAHNSPTVRRAPGGRHLQTKYGSVLWSCRISCDNELYVSYCGKSPYSISSFRTLRQGACWRVSACQ